MSAFDVVSAFDALRQQLGGGAPAIVTEAPTVAFGAPPAPPPVPKVEAPAPAPVRAPAAKRPTPSTAPSVPVGTVRLLPWQGRQFDAAALPKFQAMFGAVPGLRVTSGYRDPHENASAHGVPNSWHLKGRAADFVGPAGAMQQGAAWARANGAREVLIHNVGSGQHLHVAY